jgi:hypothetical protein
LAEARQLIQALSEFIPLLTDPLKVADIVADIGDNGQIDDPELRPLFERLEEVAGEALM